MKGSHRIIVESRKVKYDFVIHRNITIITGDSGSGKTVLIDLIHDYGRYGADSGVFLSCDCPCKVIDSEDWERKIEETTGSIILLMKEIASWFQRSLHSLCRDLIITLYWLQEKSFRHCHIV